MLIEDMRTCFGAALRYKGHGLNSTDPKELVEARDLLIQARNVRSDSKEPSATRTVFWPKAQLWRWSTTMTL